MTPHALPDPLTKADLDAAVKRLTVRMFAAVAMLGGLLFAALRHSGY
jgi:hypothetical protein